MGDNLFLDEQHDDLQGKVEEHHSRVCILGNLPHGQLQLLADFNDVGFVDEACEVA